MNKTLMIVTARYIRDHPDDHKQSTFGHAPDFHDTVTAVKPACGTTYCFAGWAAILDGWTPSWSRGYMSRVVKGDDSQDVEMVARIALGLSHWQANSLFYIMGDQERERLFDRVAELIGFDPFGPEADNLLATGDKEDSD